MSESCAVPSGQFQEFTAFDRKVCVTKDADDGKDASLYALVRAWVQNGHASSDVAAHVESSPPITLPPSQPLPKENVEYTPQCFSNFYISDPNSPELKNLASVYKSAWVTAHAHYTHHKLKRHQRHAHRHSAMLAIAQQTQKNRSLIHKPPSTPGTASVAKMAVAAPVSPSLKPASTAPTVTPAHPSQTAAPRPAASQPHADAVQFVPAPPGQGAVPPANTPQPLDARSTGGQRTFHSQPYNAANPASPGSFGTCYGMPGDVAGMDGTRQAHNLADRSGTVSSSAPGANVVYGTVNLADMQLRSTHAAGVSDGHGVSTSGSAARLPPASGAYSMHQIQQHMSLNGHISQNSAVDGLRGIQDGGMTWEGLHSEQTELQRQLQPLLDTESPVPIALRPLSEEGMPVHGTQGRASGNGAVRADEPGPGLAQQQQQPVLGRQGGSASGATPSMVQGTAPGMPGTAGGSGSADITMPSVPAPVGNYSMGASMLDMKDAFALDEVMDISPIQ